ncbi:hypothetical protein O6H91_05G031200 [Diphasiastrum complanatum]|nr:hypothetical protein O6H91_05G031200 [Diphasiastrum complanatum]
MAGIDDNDSWEWQDDSFKLDSESPLALSRSLWDELSQSEADSRSLFASTPATELREPQTAFLTTHDEDRQRCSENFERGCLRFKRRRMLLFADTQSRSLMDDPSLPVDPFKSYGNHMMEGCNDFIVPHQASPVSMWFTKNDESFSSMEYGSMEDIVEQPTEIWMAKCFNDTEAQSCEEM